VGRRDAFGYKLESRIGPAHYLDESVAKSCVLNIAVAGKLAKGFSVPAVGWTTVWSSPIIAAVKKIQASRFGYPAPVVIVFRPSRSPDGRKCFT
jgi:hypothetical protein